MSGEDLAVFVSAAAVFSAPGLSIEELNILTAVFTQLADTYGTISVIRSIEQEKRENSADASRTQQAEEPIIALESS